MYCEGISIRSIGIKKALWALEIFNERRRDI